MADTEIVIADNKTPQEAPERESAIGKDFVPTKGVIGMVALVMLVTLGLLIGYVNLVSIPKESPNIVIAHLYVFKNAGEVKPILLVAVAGAIGGIIHTLRSLYWYIGNRDLVWSWVPKYLLQPFVGGALGVVFYVVTRGGLFQSSADVKDVNLYGFSAVAALVGLFSEQALEKLRTVATTFFSPAPKGEDHASPKPNTPQKDGVPSADTNVAVVNAINVPDGKAAPGGKTEQVKATSAKPNAPALPPKIENGADEKK